MIFHFPKATLKKTSLEQNIETQVHPTMYTTINDSELLLILSLANLKSRLQSLTEILPSFPSASQLTLPKPLPPTLPINLAATPNPSLVVNADLLRSLVVPLVRLLLPLSLPISP
jgi:hypothetical protein